MPDYQTSLSTTDSIPSAPSDHPTAQYHPKAKIPIRNIPTIDAYNQWADVYDTDGNILQAIDDYELKSFLAEFITLVASCKGESEGKGDITVEVIDFGCGTGRNTVKLIHAPWPAGSRVRILGIDASKNMLQLAKSKVEDMKFPEQVEKVEFLVRDFLDPLNAGGSPVSLPSDHEHLGEGEGRCDALISTLVLEHFPLSSFFLALGSLLRIGGVALVTNMHPDMGSMSQAGFVWEDEEGNRVKVRGRSWVHGTQETIGAAKKHRFEVVGEVRECAVTEEMVRNGVVGKRGRKWVGVKVWYGLILRKVG